MASVRVAVSMLLIVAITMIGISILSERTSTLNSSVSQPRVKSTLHVHRSSFRGGNDADIALEPAATHEDKKAALNLVDQEELMKAHKRVAEATTTNGGDADPVKVDFFVMSQCPDAQFCENLWGPVLSPLSSIISVDMNYIATDLGRGSFKCMHGNDECTGNIQQLCAHNVSHDLSWFEFANCQSQSRSSIPSNGRSCADRVGISYEVIQHCVNGQQGKDLFSSSISKTNAAGAKKSCTLQLNGATWCIHDGTWKQCNEGTTADELTRAICTRYQGTTKPDACHR